MRIAFVNPQGNFDSEGSYVGAHPDFGGQLVYVRELAQTLTALGHSVDILTRQITDPAWPEFAHARDWYAGWPRLRILRFPCGPPWFLPKEELWPYLSQWVEHITRWYRDEGAWPDLWTGHYADGGLSCALLQERSGVPFTFTAHSLGAWKLDCLLELGDPFFGEPLPVSRDVLLALDSRFNFGARIAAERVVLARAAAVITSSAAERRQQYSHPAYRDVIDVEDDRRFAVIPPGVNLEIFDPTGWGPREHQIREAIAGALTRDIAPERRGLPSIIAWSRLDPKKNYPGLVRAFASSAELRACANLLLITRGLPDPLREPDKASPAEQVVLRPLVAEVERAELWGMVSAFHLAGQGALAALFRWGVDTGSVFCLPAEYEPFGLSVIEAMATGIPVVATRHGGPQETTNHGEAGLLADPNDCGDLAAQLLRLLSDRVTWHRYAARGRERVLECYSWPRSAERHALLAEEIIRGKRAGDLSFPLPEFLDRPETAELPRLTRWELASVP